MSRMHVLAVAVLSAAVSGPLRPLVLIVFEAKAAGVKVNADVPGDFIAAVKSTGRGKRRYRFGILRL